MQGDPGESLYVAPVKPPYHAHGAPNHYLRYSLVSSACKLGFHGNNSEDNDAGTGRCFCVSMVSLQLKSGLVKEGDSLYGQEKDAEGLAPWAAALSDVLLTSNCAACFVPHNPSSSPFFCQGSCQGAVTYCSRACRDLDFSAHTLSGECSLLFFRSLADDESSTIQNRFVFPSLEGTCDLRAALRLLAHHEAVGHVAQFLTASGSHLIGNETPRLGGLLSNRSILLHPRPSIEVERCPELEVEQMSIANELQATVLVMRQARLMCYISKHNEIMDKVDDSLSDSCVLGSGYRASSRNSHEFANIPTDFCTTTSTGIAGIKSLRNHETCGHLDSTVYTFKDFQTQKDANMVINGFKRTQEMADFSINTHVNANKAMRGGQDGGVCEATHANAATSSVVSSYTEAEELLLLEEVICQVFTNGVRIQVERWCLGGHSPARPDDLGTAVYGPHLSWINHSCRPNAFYSFVLGGSTTVKGSANTLLVPDRDIKAMEDAWGLKSCCIPVFEGGDCQGPRHYGPRVCLRSIRNIKGREPVYISYVDSLQPKSSRRNELWMKYRFNCMCERCDADSTNDVDAILENKCHPSMPAMEEWLQSEVQHGMAEFLEADDPSSCCKIMEDTLLKVLHDGYLHRLGRRAPSKHSTRLVKVSNGGETSFTQHGLFSGACETHAMQLDFQLMHHLCLDVYMTLSSAYNVCASDFSKGSSIEGRKEMECRLASVLYTLILAATIQYMYDYGEPGLLGIAARTWLQTGEAFITLISKLDSFFCLEDTCKKPEKVSMALLCEEEFLHEQKRVLNAHGRLSEAICSLSSSIDLLRSVLTSLWPFLRNVSPFLSHVDTPFDVNRALLRPLEMQTHILESRDAWIQHRPEAFVAALCALHHGLKLTNICYGFSEKRTVAVLDFLSLKTSWA